MYTETEGIIFKQIKTVNGRRMVLLFSKKFGKVSAGTSINEKGRGKSALAMRPFTYGKYELFKNRDSFHINGAEVIKSYYKIGEDVEKYMYCSYALEYTEKLVQEEVPAVDMFQLILDYFDIMERRMKKYDTLLIAYQIKALQLYGLKPVVDCCCVCGAKDELNRFSIQDGGIICSKCNINIGVNTNETLIYPVSFGIVDVFKYILENPLKGFEHLALDEKLLTQMKAIIRSYISYHLDINQLKSESFLASEIGES